MKELLDKIKKLNTNDAIICVLDYILNSESENKKELMDQIGEIRKLFDSQPKKYSSGEVGQMKKTHQWVTSQTFNKTRTSMMPWVSHCKACGLPMQTFKIKPAPCPKAK